MAVNASKDVTTGIHTSKMYTFTDSFNDAIQKSFLYKQSESVKMLQIEFDTIDFT